MARSLRDLTTALRHRYLHTPLQPVEGEQFAPLQQREVSSPVAPAPAPLLTPSPPSTIPAAFQPVIEIPTTTVPTQLSQLPVPVSLSPLSQDNPNSNYDRHRYPDLVYPSETAPWPAPANTSMLPPN